MDCSFFNRFLWFLLIPFSLFADYLHVKPIPWLTMDAVDFIEEFLEERVNAKIFEFGSGGSTVWFAKRTKHVVTVEHNQEWFDFISAALQNEGLQSNVEFIFHKRPYHSVISKFPKEYFDLVLVDGRDRSQCAWTAIQHIKSKGLLVLDDFERGEYHSIEKLLKKSRWTCIHTVTDYHGDPDRNFGKITKIYIRS